MKTILFQGDSITDGKWSRNLPDNGNLGYRYPALVQGALGVKYPGEYKCLNRAVSGERSIDILARVKRDIINIKPDIFSLLCGINDCCDEPLKNGLSPEKYETVLNILLAQVKEALPEIKLIILTPALLHGSLTSSDSEHPGRWEKRSFDVNEINKVTLRVARKYGAVVRELQPLFDEQLKRAPDEYWMADGIHPTAAGNQIIKNAWLDAFEELRRDEK